MLEGRRSIITGASSGIGIAITKAMCDAGARVVAVGRDDARLQAVANEVIADGGDITPVKADLTTKAGVAAVVDTAVSKFGGLDVVVHSAGVFVPKSFADTTSEDLTHQWAVNFMAPFELTKAALPHLNAGSSIIFVSSTSGRVGFSNTAAYSATKGAIDSLTRVLAVELAPEDIRVNGVAPGWIATPMNEKLREDPSVVEAAIASTPAGRLGTPEDIAPSVVFLASNASRFVQGVTLDVAGGFPSLPNVILRD